MQFKRHLTISFVVLLADMINGTDWKTRMAARLAHSICDQTDKFLQDGVMPPPEMKPDPSRSKINGEVKIKQCADSSCEPFKLFQYEAFRHERVEVKGNSFPSVAGIVRFNTGQPDYLMNGFLNGHAFFVDPSTLLTTAFTAQRVVVTSSYTAYKIVAGDTSKDKYQEDIKITGTSTHPNYNSTTLENNFGLIHLEKPVTFNDKIKNISLQAAGGKCNGKIKFASWTKMRIGGEDSHVWNYQEKLQEIKSLNLDSSSKCPDGAICASPLLCGMWDQGAPLICSTGSMEHAYAIASHYFVDMYKGGPICGGFTTFYTLDKAIDWILKAKKTG